MPTNLRVRVRVRVRTRIAPTNLRGDHGDSRGYSCDHRARRGYSRIYTIRFTQTHRIGAGLHRNRIDNELSPQQVLQVLQRLSNP